MNSEFDGLAFPSAEARTYYINMDAAGRQTWRDEHPPMKPPLPSDIIIEPAIPADEPPRQFEQPGPEVESERDAPQCEQPGPAVEPEHDAVRLLRILAPEGPWTVRTISSLEGGSPQLPRKLGFHVGPDNVDDAENGLHGWIAAAETGKHHCYYHVGVGPDGKQKLSEADLIGSHACHVDVDPADEDNPITSLSDFEERRAKILAAMQAEEPPFSIIIDSGNGYQALKRIEPYRLAGDSGKLETLKAGNRAIAASLNNRLEGTGLTADTCHSADHLMRLPGTINFTTQKKLDKGYPPGNRPARIVEWHPERIYKLEELPSRPDSSSEGGKSESKSADIAVDWARVPAQDVTCLKDLPADFSRKGRIIIEHAGTLKELSERLKDAGLLQKGYSSWSEVTMALAAVLKSYGKFSPEVMAAVLTAPLPCNQHVTNKKEDDRRHAVDRALSRAFVAPQQKPTDLAELLAEMNVRHCVLPVGGKTRVMTLRDSMAFPGRKETSFSTFDDFVNLYSNRGVTIVTADGPKTISMGKWWLYYAHGRRQYDGGRQFMPQTDEPVVGDTLNLWTGFAVVPSPEGSWDLFKAHIRDNICSGNEEHFQYLIKHNATIVQKRIRSEIAVLLRSDEEGTGKGFYVKHFGHLFGPHYMQVSKPEHVIGKHNEHLEHLLVLCADEALFAGDPRHRNALYNLITEPTITIEPKFVGAYSAPNNLNTFITTNAQHAVPVGPWARRVFALNVAPNQMQKLEYFDAIEKQLKNGGYQRMLYDLQHLDLAGFDVRRVPKTAALAQQAALSRDGVDALVETIAHTAWLPFQHHIYPNVASTKGEKRGEGFWSWVKDNFSDLQRRSPHGMAKALEPWGCKSWNSQGPHVRFPEDINELREQFDAKHGPQDWSADPTEWVKDSATAQMHIGGGSTARPTHGGEDKLPF
jgi:hypothetical protein